MVAGAIIHINFLMPAASRLKSLTWLRTQLLWLNMNTKYRLAFLYWLLPNYQQDVFNAMSSWYNKRTVVNVALNHILAS